MTDIRVTRRAGTYAAASDIATINPATPPYVSGSQA